MATGKRYLGPIGDSSESQINKGYVDGQVVVAKDYTDTKVNDVINSLASAIEYKGTFDPTAGTFAALTDAKKGDFYKASTAGTVDGIDFQIGDGLIINKDVIGIPVAADVDKIDNTESPDLVRLLEAQTLENKTMDGDKNTFSNIGIASIKTVLADAKKALRRDATGAVVSVADGAAVDIGDGAATQFVVNHDLNTRAVMIEVISNVAPFDTIDVPVERTTAGSVTIKFGIIPAANEFKVLLKPIF